MKGLLAFLLTLVACALYGCTPWANSLTPPVGMTTPDPGCGEACFFGGDMVSPEPHIGGDIGKRVLNERAIGRETGYNHVSKSAPSGYVYVADGKAQALEVYRFGYSGSPLRIVKLDGAGFAVVADDKGRVYVSELLNSEVQVFDSGAVHAIGKLQGVNAPSGMYADGDTVYVTNHASAQSPGFVGVYSNGSLSPSNVINAPRGTAPVGVAVDAKGDVFEALIDANGSGALYEYNGSYHFIAALGTATRGGLTMDGHGNPIVGDLGRLTTFLAPDFKQTRVQGAPQHGILEWFTHNDLGTFVPMNDGDGKSSVTVYPANGAEAPYVLREGTQTPQGAAAGI